MDRGRTKTGVRDSALQPTPITRNVISASRYTLNLNSTTFQYRVTSESIGGASAAVAPAAAGEGE